MAAPFGIGRYGRCYRIVAAQATMASKGLAAVARPFSLARQSREHAQLSTKSASFTELAIQANVCDAGTDVL
jgi:hypothetical protein